MAYIYLDDKALDDPLGPGTLNAQRSNILFNRDLLAAEHLYTGEHNVREIARVCSHVSGTTVTPTTTDISSVTHPSTGKYIVNLDVSRFPDADLRVQITPTAESNKPAIATYKIVDGLPATLQIEVYLKKMTSTLGVAGNTWVDYDAAFEIAIHSTPLADSGWETPPDQWLRANANAGYGLVGGGYNPGPFSWSWYVREMATQYTQLTAKHTSAGEHNDRQIAKYSGHIYYNGSVYKCDTYGFTLTHSGTGLILVDYASITTPVSPFFCADYARMNSGTDVQTLVCTTGATATRTSIQAYAWDSAVGCWNLADIDFFIAVHGS